MSKVIIGICVQTEKKLSQIINGSLTHISGRKSILSASMTKESRKNWSKKCLTLRFFHNEFVNLISSKGHRMSVIFDIFFTKKIIIRIWSDTMRKLNWTHQKLILSLFLFVKNCFSFPVIFLCNKFTTCHLDFSLLGGV